MNERHKFLHSNLSEGTIVIPLLDIVKSNINTLAEPATYGSLGFVCIGEGSEGIVLEHRGFIGQVVKVFFNQKHEEELGLYSLLKTSVYLPLPTHVDSNFKIMPSIYSDSLMEFISKSQTGYGSIKPVFVLSEATGVKFNYKEYRSKMEGLIDYIVELAENQIYINDLSLSNIHFNYETEQFIILDYDVLSSTVFEFPRFLESKSLPVFKNYFLTKLKHSNINHCHCKDPFSRFCFNNGTTKDQLTSTEEISLEFNWYTHLVESKDSKTKKTLDTIYYI